MLLPWQKFILSQVFGWKRREDNTRRFRFVYIEVPRKNGKTTLLAGIGLYMLVADGEPGAEVYSAATTRVQAKEIWDEAAAMAETSLKRYVKVSKYSITVPKNPSAKFIALAAEGKTLDGKNVHCAHYFRVARHPGEIRNECPSTPDPADHFCYADLSVLIAWCPFGSLPACRPTVRSPGHHFPKPRS